MDAITKNAEELMILSAGQKAVCARIGRASLMIKILNKCMQRVVIVMIILGSGCATVHNTHNHKMPPRHSLHLQENNVKQEVDHSTIQKQDTAQELAEHNHRERYSH